MGFSCCLVDFLIAFCMDSSFSVLLCFVDSPHETSYFLREFLMDFPIDFLMDLLMDFPMDILIELLTVHGIFHGFIYVRHEGLPRGLPY